MHIDYAWISACIILIESPYCIAIHTILLHSDDSTHTYSYVVNAIIKHDSCDELGYRNRNATSQLVYIAF